MRAICVITRSDPLSEFADIPLGGRDRGPARSVQPPHNRRSSEEGKRATKALSTRYIEIYCQLFYKTLDKPDCHGWRGFANGAEMDGA